MLVAAELPMAETAGNRDPVSLRMHTHRHRLVERLHTGRLLPPRHKCVFSEDRSKPTDHSCNPGSDVVRNADFLEHPLRLLSVVHILVWMPLESKLTVARRSIRVDTCLRSFQFLRCSIVSYVQHIVVASRHHGRRLEE